MPVPKISIPKDILSSLPMVECSTNVEVIETAAKARQALAKLMRAKEVGLDTETRPNFRKGDSHTVALIQISTMKDSYLFRINKFGFIDELRDFLQSEQVKKIGLSLRDDFNGLRRIGEVEPANVVELQDYVGQYGIVDASLQKIYGLLFGRRISKGQRLTNWEAQQLTEAQQHYAAIDAWACLKIYRYLERGSFNPEASPYILPPEEEQPQP
ncbi:MAG: 3'-5' exonuclease domain-containing protein 2 [Paramuribaculum sp.]|nr:3'-5' exonuclease domain-containing protein 2 [Paramuribaculum sp.]